MQQDMKLMNVIIVSIYIKKKLYTIDTKLLDYKKSPLNTNHCPTLMLYGPKCMCMLIIDASLFHFSNDKSKAGIFFIKMIFLSDTVLVQSFPNILTIDFYNN